MDHRTKIKLLSEIDDLIMQLGGIEAFEMQKIGISMYEYENPTFETVERLRNYVETKLVRDEEKKSYGK